MYRIGTSGFSYQDWIGPFYEEGITKKEMLNFYSREFDCVEINSTYYKIPHPAVMYYLGEKVGKDFEFVVKANKQMTHEGRGQPQIFKQFKQCLEPLIRAKKFGVVLAQFPWSFKKNKVNIEYLTKFREMMDDIQVVVEFRNSEWIDEEVYVFLEENNFGFCNVDEPKLKGLLPSTKINTSEIGYYRFHGRNKEYWWKKGVEPWRRYDYLYEENELRETFPLVREVIAGSKKTYLFFNNHYRGQAVKNARMLKKMLLEEEE